MLKIIKKTPKNKIPQTKIWGIFKKDSRVIPATSDKQRKNNILDGLT